MDYTTLAARLKELLKQEKTLVAKQVKLPVYQIDYNAGGLLFVVHVFRGHYMNRGAAGTIATVDTAGQEMLSLYQSIGRDLRLAEEHLTDQEVLTLRQELFTEDPESWEEFHLLALSADPKVFERECKKISS